MGVLRALGTLYNSIIRNKIMDSESTDLDWEDLEVDFVEIREGVYARNQKVADDLNFCKVGFYAWTNKSNYVKKIYKKGQSVDGSNRFKPTDNHEPIVIFEWIPSELARIKRYDQKIMQKLHDSGEAVWLVKVNRKDSAGTEFLYYPNNNPGELLRRELEGKNIRRDIKLVIWQIEVLELLINEIALGKVRIVAELAARFGKTLLYLVLHSLLNYKVLVVSSYFLSSFNSFQEELFRYSIFENWIFLELSDKNFGEKFENALKTDAKIVIVASLCGSSNVDKNSPLIKDFSSKFIVTDEADYGAHTPPSVKILKKFIGDNVHILTTGTNSERAVGKEPPDALIKCSYFDMVSAAFS
jgi:hypothetical protein